MSAATRPSPKEQPGSFSAAAEEPYDYETIDPGYYDRIYRRGSGVQSKWHHLKFAHLRRLMRPEAEHLDIGCGPGTFIGTLDSGIRSTGVDIAATQVCYATDTYGTAQRRFLRIAPGALPFPAESFDTVTCIELVEHLPREEGLALCREARRTLRRDGTLLLTTPDYGGLWPLLEMAVNRLGEVSYESQHVSHYTRAKLASLLREAGYAEVRVERFQFLAPFAAVLGWKAADSFAQWEPEWLTRRFGFLLVARARP
jgi:2-polyprenyl-3-methyl-5-hydroxy-6-metoxy-1,4-benzoquinol methylase